jgi:ribosome biogenesis protein YTM1
MAEKDEEQLQIHLITKQTQFAVPDTPYSIQSSVTTVELNKLLNTLLKETQDEMYTEVDFDFLVRGEFLRHSLAKHLKDREVSFEDVIDIEYVERFPAPEPLDVLLHDDWVSAIQANGDWILTGSYDNSVNIWSMKGEHKLSLTGDHEAPIKGVGWINMNEDSGTATFASGSKDQTILIWQWNIAKNKARPIFSCKGHERAVECISISQNGKLIASGGWDNFLKVWSASSDDENDSSETSKKMRTEEAKVRTPLATLEGHREAVSSTQWIDNTTILSSSWDHTMKIWDLNMRALKNEIAGNKSFFDVSYSALNGLIITASADKNLRLFDPKSNRKFILIS